MLFRGNRRGSPNRLAGPNENDYYLDALRTQSAPHVTPKSSPWLDRLAHLLVRLGFLAIVVVGVLVATLARADSTPPAPAASSAPASVSAPSKPPGDEPTKRYIFSWPLTSDPALAPRGGTTRGPDLTLDKAPSDAWRALQAPALSSFERDRRAILAMAGSYRVTFEIGRAHV